MSSGIWKKFRFDDLLVKRNQGVNTTTEKVKYSEGGIPVIRAQNITSSGLSFRDSTYIDEQTFERVRDECKPKLHDVLYTNIGSQFGSACVVNRDEPFLIAWNVMRLQVGDKLNPYFLKYLLNNPEMKAFIRGLNSSSTMPFVSGKEIGNLIISAPTIPTQTRIAAILSALDDKIGLNRETNATLEAIAQAIFKEWFVNFRYPGATGAMQDSKLGNIPKAWLIRKLGDVVEIQGGTTPSTKNPEYWGGEYAWSTPRDLSNLQSPVLLDTERKISDKGVQQISSGILPKGTLLLSSRAPIGYLAITQLPVSINQGYIAIQGRLVSNLFMLFWLSANMGTIKERANGSTFQEISKSNFREIDIILPSTGALNDFEASTEPLFNQIVKNEIENKLLSQLRDNLLPKLMSGEIEV